MRGPHPHFDARDYARQCPDAFEYHETAKDQCNRCQALKRQLTKKIGAPSKGGLLKLRAESKLDLSSLLVCRHLTGSRSSALRALHL
jgi:hypothetical protein